MLQFLPEWQIQESLAADPSQLEIPGRFEGIRVQREQRYLPSIGRYIDLLCTTKKPRGWLIVEIKAQSVTSREPIDQALDYRSAFAKELRLSKADVGCMIAAPGHPTPDVEDLSKSEGVTLRDLDLTALIDPGRGPKSPGFLVSWEARRFAISDRRKHTLETFEGSTSPSNRSVETWLKQGNHDPEGLTELGRILRSLSESAPIFAHEVGGKSTRLDTASSQWFWLFYSSLDRRGNAALFIRARRRLEREGLFDPRALCNLIAKRGESGARAVLTSLLQEAEVPLLVDLQHGRESLAQSIIDAARFVIENNGFDNMIRTWRDACAPSGEDLGRFAVRAVQRAVYGMGPRSAAQFVRGMALKGPWKMDLWSPAFLENTKYHGLFAGRARLSIANEDYPKEGGAFADKYLDGNRGVLSHALWYVRKRYCDKAPLCGECPMAGYCAYFRRVGPAQARRAHRVTGLGQAQKQLTLPTDR